MGSYRAIGGGVRAGRAVGDGDAVPGGVFAQVVQGARGSGGGRGSGRGRGGGRGLGEQGGGAAGGMADGGRVGAEQGGDETSDAVKLSSCLGKFFSDCGERDGFAVTLAGCQAVVQAAEQAAEQVALGGGMPVAVVAATVVVGASAG